MKHEKLLFLLISILVLSLTVISFIFGYVKTPEGMEFLGRRVVNFQDTYPAISLIEQAKHGKFIFRNLYSSDSNNIIISPVFLLLGQISHVLPFSTVILFHVARLILGFILLWIIYQFLRIFFEKAHQRILAFLIISLSGGIGFFTYRTVSNSYDLFLPTANLFLSLFESPELIFAEILLVILLSLVFQILKHEKHTAKQVLISVISFIILSAVQIFSLPQYTVIAAILPVFISLTFQLILIFIGWEAVSRQTNIIKMAVFSLAVFFLPTPFQKLSIFSLFILLSILSAHGFFHIYDRFLYPNTKKSKIAGLISYLLIAVFLLGLLPATNYFHIYWDMQGYVKDKKDNYLSYLLKDELAAVNWLKNNSPGDSTVLAKPFYGNIIGGVTARKIYLGNEYYTASFNQKLENVNNLITVWGATRSAQYLKDNRIAYLFFGKDDSMISESFKPEKVEFIKQVFSQNGVAVYQFTAEKKQLPQPVSPSITKAPPKKTSVQK